MTNSPIFIVGCPRSGTGLLRNLLRSHPHLSFPTESHFIPKLYRAYGDPRNEREARTLAAVILKTDWVQRWEINLPASAFGHFRTEPYSRKVLKPNLSERRWNRHSVFWHPHRKRVSETEVVRSNSGMWRKAMRVSDRVIFESVAGDLLRELGYQTEGKIRHVSQSEHLRWIALHYFWFILKRLGTRDKNTWIPSHLLLRWATFRYYLRSVGVLGQRLRGGGWG